MVESGNVCEQIPLSMRFSIKQYRFLKSLLKFFTLFKAPIVNTQCIIYSLSIIFAWEQITSLLFFWLWCAFRNLASTLPPRHRSEKCKSSLEILGHIIFLMISWFSYWIEWLGSINILSASSGCSKRASSSSEPSTRAASNNKKSRPANVRISPFKWNEDHRHVLSRFTKDCVEAVLLKSRRCFSSEYPWSV